MEFIHNVVETFDRYFDSVVSQDNITLSQVHDRKDIYIVPTSVISWVVCEQYITIINFTFCSVSWMYPKPNNIIRFRFLS